MATRRLTPGLQLSRRAQSGFKVLDKRISAADEAAATKALATAKSSKPKANVHVVTHGDAWATRTEKSSKVGRIVSTQKQALARAKRQADASKVNVVLHGQDGRIRDVITPRPSKRGKK